MVARRWQTALSMEDEEDKKKCIKLNLKGTMLVVASITHHKLRSMVVPISPILCSQKPINDDDTIR